MTKTDILSAINQWEQDHGESFIDYFAHDRINQTSWGSWLLGFGMGKEDVTLITHAHNIIEELVIENEYIDQEILFEIYPEHSEDVKEMENNCQKNLEMIAEFLAATEYYENMFINWFKTYPKNE
jgi:hypothetical protein